jgi:hypothetical protein
MRELAWVLASVLASAAVSPCAYAADSAPRVDAAPPVLVQLTDAASTLYNVDNRDAERLNDDWGMFYNRLNLQATRGRFTLQLRLDNAWFFTSPSPSPPPAERADGLELSNRFINWVYPAKYALLYTGRDLEVAVGDSSAQLGRGLVLSARKLDELASDTTVRGVRVTGRVRAGEVRLKLTALGGSLNPLRIDEASGRYLGVHSSVTPDFITLTEAGMPRAVSTDFVPETDRCATFTTCTYAPDRIVAGAVEAAVGSVTLVTQASLLLRQGALAQDLVRSADRITTASQSVDVPKLFGQGSLYVEAALQRLEHRGSRGPELEPGHAVYLAASWVDREFSWLAEGKHYRRFFPLSANVKLDRAAEFAVLQYSTPPTTEEVWNDTEFGNFNTCVSGGRIRADLHLDRRHTVYGWLGHYVSFAESASERCETASANANRVWDSAAGLEITRPRVAAKTDVQIGSRFDTAGRDLDLDGAEGSTRVFYRELYLRYDVTTPLVGALSLELQGVHRRRRETVGGPGDVWFELEHSTGIEWGEQLGLALGVEYDSRPGTAHHFLNVMTTYRPSDAVSLGLFAGQRRGALRCVGGVCRVYPPFEGGRLDVTVRY